MNRFETPSGTARRTSQPRAGAQRQKAFRLHPIAAALLLLAGNTWYGPGEAQAQTLPTGAQVVQGQASVSTVGNQMMVTSSANAALNWQSFSVGAANSVRFDQPSASSQVLNRVVGNDPSNILGSISSNGKVWLLNPNGILFGRDARVDVAGLVASTLNISNADWQAQQLRLRAGGGAGTADATLVNQGNIRSTTGGNILLIGGKGGVRNEGLIETQGGQITLAAGGSVDLVDEGLPNLAVRVAAPQGEALNLGALAAGAGQIDIQAAIVNQNGIVRADSVDGSGGTVVLRASEALNTSANSITTANGVTGGRVTADSQGGTSLIAGSVEASGTTGRGGQVKLLGKQVGVLDGAMVTASGGAGGGEVFVGGGLQGKDAQVPNAESTFIARGAALSADATDKGDGGRVIVWSDKTTRAYGSFSARGGPAGGDGGFIETSGGWLDAQPLAVRTNALNGKTGLWMIDPYDITITDSQVTGNINISGNPDFSSTGQPSLLTTATINTALGNNNNVTVTTEKNGGTGAGDINLLGATISASPSTPVSLTLNAEHSIYATNSTISSSGAPLNVVFNAANGGAGSISLQQTSITTSGNGVDGNITLGVPGPNNGFRGAVANDTSEMFGVYVDSRSTLNAGNSRIAINGFSTAQGTGIEFNPAFYGVWLEAGSQLAAKDIAITGGIDSNAMNWDRRGIFVEGTLFATHSIQLNGSASSSQMRTSDDPDTALAGVYINSGANVIVAPRDTNPTASLNISGFSANSAANPSTDTEAQARYGVYSSGNLFASNSATVTINGTDSPSVQRAIALGGVVNFASAGPVSLSSLGDILVYGTMIAPTGQALSVSGNIVEFSLQQGPITGSPRSFDVSASLVIYASKGFGTPSSQNFDITFSGGTQVALTAPYIQTSDLGRNFSVSTDGPIALSADRIELHTGTTLTSSASGNAITVSGQDGSSPTQRFFAGSTGAPVMNTPNGRWLVYAANADPDIFSAGNLFYSFKQYGASSVGIMPLGTGNGLLFSIAPTVTISNGSVWSQVYDGTAIVSALNDKVTLAGLLPGDHDNGDLLGNFVFTGNDKNVGTNKPISLVGFQTPTGQIPLFDAADKPVYGYTVQTNLVGNVTPKPVTLVGVGAANKVYDGTTAVVLSGSVAGFVGSETLDLSLSGQFNDKNVGTDKTVSGTATLVNGSNGSLAGNYALANNAVATTASITPAELTYQATPTTRGQGEPLGSFTGSVTGFVGSETQQSATTGTLEFVSPASTASPVGSYAINGTGLSADNYTFTQAPSNATALTLVPAARQTTPPEARVQPVTPPVVLTTPTQGRALDVVQALRVNVDGGTAFGGLDVSGMSLDELASVLEARNRYKQSLLAEGTTKLESNPALADAPPCTTLEQADSGTCLLTEALKAKVQAAKANATTDVAVAPSKDPAAPRQGSKPAAAAAPTAGPVAAPAAPLSRPIIRNAALPQIQRKFAVIIGIDNYSDGRIPKLDNAQSDASAVADVLGSKLGYETTVINDASREAILRRLNRLVAQVGPHDSVVIYYAGHGTVVEKTGLGYWLPANADASRPETWISNSDIGKLLSQFSASQVALISDSCFSGSLVSDERIRTSAQTADAATLLGRRAAVVMSSGGNEPVSDSGKEGHSVFSWSLMRTLEKVSAWRPGANVFEQVRFAVARQLPQRPAYGAARAGGHQAGADYVFEQRQFDGIGP